MNCLKTRSGLLLAFLLFPFAILAQKPTIKYGNVRMEELMMPVYTPDSTANAVVLADVGYTYVNSTINSFNLVHERHCRIKIFNKAALDEATVAIMYDDETITQIKGSTYLLENGKMVEFKLDSKAIFDEKVNARYRKKKFTLPNVKEGAVIEFSYTIRSDSFTFFKEWEFQSKYPVLWSEYTARVPQQYDYRIESQGYNSFFVSEKKEETGGTLYHWVMKDVPAFEDDQYITTADDYISKVKFQLKGVQYPGSFYKPVLSDWEKVTKVIYEDDGFTSSIYQTGFLKDKIKQITAKHTDPVSKSFALTLFLKNAVKWNGLNRMFPAQSPKILLEKKTGSSADINLLLVGMLRDAGLPANPVILSTRKNGRVNEYYPMIDNFNYVIASVRIDSTDLLLDATDPYRPAYLLPERCLNSKGRLIEENRVGRWINLENYLVFASKAANISLSINNGKVSGTATVYEKDYSAANTRAQLAEANSKDDYVKGKYKVAGLTITDYSLENLENIDTTMVTQLSFEYDAEDTPGILYINPILFNSFNGNAFKAKHRTYPVSYPTLTDLKTTVTVAVPPGYAIEELPKPAKYNLSEDGAKFTYLIGQVGDKIQLRSIISFNKTMFLADEYEGLKAFYAAVSAKLTEQIVLKKINN
ncbi:DUF3857 domain-containing protein [Solitalea longa]|nr:DUF3857 domain-containing protein [Solitalea longa]